MIKWDDGIIYNMIKVGWWDDGMIYNMLAYMGWFHFMSGRGAGKMFGRGADFIFDAETYKPLAPQDEILNLS